MDATMNASAELTASVNETTGFASHVAHVERSLIRLLSRLRMENRRMTPRELDRFSVGVRDLSVWSGYTTTQVIASLRKCALLARERD